MTRRTRLWLGLASVFTLVNAGGAVYALAEGEALHAATHVALALLGGCVVRALLARGRYAELPDPEPAGPRLERLQASLDAIAAEVERVGEAQRFTARLIAEQQDTPPHKADR